MWNFEAVQDYFIFHEAAGDYDGPAVAVEAAESTIPGLVRSVEGYFQSHRDQQTAKG